jgi:aminoglycoside 6'-N-acetyltransferase
MGPEHRTRQTCSHMGSDDLTLRPFEAADMPKLRRIRATRGVARWWGPPSDDFAEIDSDTSLFTIEVNGAAAGLIQIYEEPDPKYRHASIDLFLDPALHGRGLGTEAVRQAVSHVIGELGHHRVTIDPAAANAVAIRAYEKVGFRRVGVMRSYERDADGDGWHDGLLMELLAS